MKQRIPKAIYSKEFREQAVKQVTDEPLTYTRRASEAFTAGRLDSDYFAPRVLEPLQKLGGAGLTVGAVAPTRHERFSPGKEGVFDYIEIGNMRADGTVGAERLPQNEPPSRATSFVRAGGVITSRAPHPAAFRHHPA